MAVYVSDLLTVTPAPVDASPTSTRTWQWLRGSTTISGATSTTYTTTADDIGSSIFARQSETNFLGTTTATSAATETVQAFDPIRLFSASEPGVWFDPNDIATLFVDPAGTTPVTAPGDRVGLMLDKSKGPQGPQLVTNGNFEDGLTGWTVAGTATMSVIGGELSLVSAGAGGSARATISTVVGRQYHIFGTSRQITSRGQILVGSTAGGAEVLSFSPISGTQTVGNFFVAVGTTTYLTLGLRDTAAGVEVRYDNISVRETQGNHATQATETKRPNYGIVPAGGRRNIFLQTEDFSNAAWAKTTTSPVTTLTNQGGGVWRLQAAAGTWSLLQNWSDAATHSVSFDVKSNGAGLDNFSLMLGGTFVGGNRTATSEWVRYSASGNNGGSGFAGIVRNTSNDAVDILIRFPQLELGSTATPYQRVTSQYDVTEAGVASLGYLQFDGTDDWMSTGTITPGTDKAQVFAGVRKLTDATIGQLVEFSPNAGTNSGALSMPAAISGATWSAGVKGAGLVTTATATNLAAPITTVNAAIYDLALASGDAQLRIDGTLRATSSGDTGGGNFLAYSLYLGYRNATADLYLNGQLFPLIVRFGTTLTTARIQSTELWVGERTPGIDLEKVFSPIIYTRSGDTILDRANSTIERRA